MVNQAGVLYQSNANTSRPSCKGKDRDCGRNRMAIKQSTDGGSWQPVADVWDGAAAYSQLVALGNHQLGLLFEAGAPGGSNGGGGGGGDATAGGGDASPDA